MTDKQMIIDGKEIKCPCYIDRPLHRYDKGCLIQSQTFSEQQTQEKPILRCDEIKNCPIKEQYLAIKRKEQECKALREEKAYTDWSCDQLKTELEQMTALKDTYFACYHAKHEDLAKKYDQLKAENEEFEETVNNLIKVQYCLADRCTKYSQTLNEIKEIAKHFTEKGLEPQSVEHQLKLRGKEELAKIILQKISEVGNGE